MKTIYYDIETTGLNPEKDRIIEIAAYNPQYNESFTQFVNPERSIPSESVAITGITDSMVASAPTFEVVGQQFIEFCGPGAVLIAHNNDQFDKLFITTESSRTNLQLPPWEYVDTLKWSRKYRKDLPSHSLQFLREVYGYKIGRAHRALDDSMALHHIFSIMIDDLSIETVLKLLSQTTISHTMPFGKYQGRPLSEVPRNYFQWLLNSGALEKSENQQLKETLTKMDLLH
jgi:DNA polymerase III subunit epsilon